METVQECRKKGTSTVGSRYQNTVTEDTIGVCARACVRTRALSSDNIVRALESLVFNKISGSRGIAMRGELKVLCNKEINSLCRLHIVTSVLICRRLQ
jgi:hypothetical protein